MASEFQLSILTPERTVFEGAVEYVQVPGSEGYLGVLAHHAPLITPLRPGRLDVRDTAGVESSYAVSGGFLEVSANRATVLADTAERVDEIDRTRAEASLKRAEARLTDAPRDVDRGRAQRSLERAKNRLAISKG